MKTDDYHPSLAGIPMPPTVAALPVDPVRKLPVPWFVPKGVDGRPNWLAGDGTKIATAITQRRCWVCGQRLGPVTEAVAFVGGPTLVFNGASAEPPNHEACAEFAVRACPHMVRPNAKRRLTPDVIGTDPNYSGAGQYLDHKPTVVCVVLVTAFHAARVDDGIVFYLDSPGRVRWYAEGRPATRAEAAAGLDGSAEAALKAARSAARSVAERQDMMGRVAAARSVLPREGPAAPQTVAGGGDGG